MNEVSGLSGLGKTLLYIIKTKTKEKQRKKHRDKEIMQEKKMKEGRKDRSIESISYGLSLGSSLPKPAGFLFASSNVNNSRVANTLP